MLYFDSINPVLEYLSDEEFGRLLRGVFDYAQNGTFPELEGALGLAFGMLKPSIDLDAEKYEQAVLHSQYMVYCKKARDQGKEPLPQDEYFRQLQDTNSDYQIPTTTTDPSSTPSPVSTPSPNPFSNPTNKGNKTLFGKGETEGSKGDEGGNLLATITCEEDFERKRLDLQRRISAYK